MARTFLASVFLVTVGMAMPVVRPQQPEQPSLAELARRTEEARKKAAEQQAGSSKTDKADAVQTAKTPANTDKSAEKAEGAASKDKKVYTNADLSALGGSTNAKPANDATPSAAADSSNPEPKNETDQMKARRVLKFELDRIAFKIRDWYSSSTTFLKMCDPGSYLGLKGGALEGHRKFCLDYSDQVKGKETNIDQLVNELQDRASKEGVLPGTARDLVKAMGWK